MKSYLSLIPISAKVHKRQNRMTLLCIIFSVFLVTSVFSMADMGVRMEKERLMLKHGNMDMGKIASTPAMTSLYVIAFILFLLILVAGILMISSSLNSNIAQRISFFGMMRCIGMSRAQIIRFVRLEALNWCKTAIPIGLAAGISATWILCAILKFAVGGEFAIIPLFKISIPGILSGIILALVTVLIAAGAPAKHAAKVPPVAAVSGNISSKKSAAKKVSGNKGFFKIETSLGISHAVSSKKNLLLITGSFALSIVLFLSFSVFTDLVNHIMPQSVATPDMTVSVSRDSNSKSAAEMKTDKNISVGDNIIETSLAKKISKIQGVEKVYGRSSSFNIPATITDENGKLKENTVLRKNGKSKNSDDIVENGKSKNSDDTVENGKSKKNADMAENGKSEKNIDIISYDNFDLQSLKRDGVLKRGSDLSKVYGNSNYILTTWDKNSSLKIGDKINVKGKTLEIAGMLKYDPFSSDGDSNGKITVISSAPTFRNITGINGYSLLMIKTENGISDRSISEIKKLTGDNLVFSDKRDQNTAGTYAAFMLFVYGFLVVITLVTVLNIMNNISMSVSARIKQYGAMRAVGMGNKQVRKMIAAEAATYAVSGCVTGCVLGLLINRWLFNTLIASHFSYESWSVPVVSLLIILAFIAVSTVLAVYSPTKRIRNLSITETISEL